MILTPRNWVKKANSWLTEKTLRYDASSLYLPAGETPRKLYANWNEDPHPALQYLELYQVDDVIDGPGKDMFAHFFASALPQWKVKPPTEHVQANLGILGLGTNGHVAFHEPGVSPSLRFGEVVLHDDTARRLDLSPGTRARTFGLGAFMDTDALLLIVRGHRKEKVLRRMLKGDTSLPATLLLKHPDLTILVAKD